MFVYAFKLKDKQRFKIGRTNNTSRRLRELQTGNPFDLQPYAVVQCPSSDVAIAVEKHMRRAVGGRSREGGSEWHMVDSAKLNLVLFEVMTRHNEVKSWQLKWILKPRNSSVGAER